MAINGWPLPPETPNLESDSVHVWWTCLDLTRAQAEEACRVLSPDELWRAQRFLFSEDRKRFVARRAILREVLSLYVQLPPDRLTFRYGPYGKPELAVPGRSWLRFNLSHSHEQLIFALARDREVGIDVEFMRPDLRAGALGECCLSAREVAAWSALPDGLKVQAFFRCWTQKEAYIKARGVGLSIPLDSFDVSVVPGEPAALLNVRGMPGEPLSWSLKSLNVQLDYAATVAAQGQDWVVQCWNYIFPLT